MSNLVINSSWQNMLPELKDNSVDLIIIDPPYLLGKEEWDKENQVTEELSNQLFRILKPTGSFYCWGGIGERSHSAIDWFILFNSTNWVFKDWITWKKQRGMGMRKGWLYTREELMWFVKDNHAFIWNKQYSESEKRTISRLVYNDPKKQAQQDKLNEFKRVTNVWTDIMEVGLGTSPQKGHMLKEISFHYTPKPIKALERIILAHTKEGDMVLDCFAGSGTVGIACKNLNRNSILIEINETYCEHMEKI